MKKIHNNHGFHANACQPHSTILRLSGDQLLWCLSPIWPRNRTEALSQQTIRQAPTLLRRNRNLVDVGVWKMVDVDVCLHDEIGWFILHWPRVLDTFLKSGITIDRVTRCIPSLKTLQTACRNDPAARYAAWRSLQSTFDAQMPPGALLRAPMSLTSVLSEFSTEKYDTAGNPQGYLDEFSVVKCGQLSATAHEGNVLDLETRLNRLSVFQLVNLMKINPVLLDLGHPLIKFLYMALMRLHTTPEHHGWAHWGILWTKKGLVFNPAIAAKHVEDDPAVAVQLGLRTFTDERAHDLIARTTDPSTFSRRDLATFPPIDSLITNTPASREHIAKSIEPLKSLYTNTELAVYQSCHKRECLYFPIESEKSGIIQYFKQLILVSAELTKPDPKLPRALRRCFPQFAPKTKKYIPKHRGVEHSKLDLEDKERMRPVALCQFNAFDLSYWDPDRSETLEEGLPFQPMTMEFAQWAGYQYMSFPVELAEKLPELKEPVLLKDTVISANLGWQEYPTSVGTGVEHIVLRINDDVLTVKSPLNTVEINYGKQERRPDRSPNTFKPKVGIGYFIHPTLFVPNGPAHLLLDAIKDNRPGISIATKNLIEAFQVLCRWIYSPELCTGMISGELEAALSPESPVILDTPSARLKFLQERATRSRYHVPPHESELGAKGQRSKQMVDYDRFLYWYVAKYELAVLWETKKWAFCKEDQAQYICKRWMRWRRELASMPHLVDPYPGISRRDVKGLISYNDWNKLLTTANKMFGRSPMEL